MVQLFVILMRILFPRDPVARYRELMRVWLRHLIDCVSDPEELEAFAYWSEDRAKLESRIAYLEYFMRCLTHDRARQMLGLKFIYFPLQPQHHIRNPSSLGQLFKRITQLARDFHNLDQLAARRAERMRRERDSDPLRLAATLQSTSRALRAVEANDLRTFNVQLASTCASHLDGLARRSAAQAAGGGASSRGPPKTPDSPRIRHTCP